MACPTCQQLCPCRPGTMLYYITVLCRLGSSSPINSPGPAMPTSFSWSPQPLWGGPTATARRTWQLVRAAGLVWLVHLLAQWAGTSRGQHGPMQNWSSSCAVPCNEHPNNSSVGSKVPGLGTGLSRLHVELLWLCMVTFADRRLALSCLPGVQGMSAPLRTHTSFCKASWRGFLSTVTGHYGLLEVTFAHDLDSRCHWSSAVHFARKCQTSPCPMLVPFPVTNRAASRVLSLCWAACVGICSMVAEARWLVVVQRATEGTMCPTCPCW